MQYVIEDIFGKCPSAKEVSVSDMSDGFMVEGFVLHRLCSIPAYIFMGKGFDDGNGHYEDIDFMDFTMLLSSTTSI